MTADSIRLTLDAQAILSRSELFFENQGACIGELAQNGHRAGASTITFDWQADSQTLCYSDDGEGIADFADLLHKGQSHWERAEAWVEQPYGLGFLACLNCGAETITVESGTRRLGPVRCRALLDGDPAPITDLDAPVAGTRIHLAGVPASERPRQSTFEGFPIPVIIDGKPVDRRCAVQEDTHHVPVIGLGVLVTTRPYAAPLDGLSLARQMLRGPSDRPSATLPALFLNGLPTSAPSVQGRRPYNCHALHLDPRLFAAVMPDRARLTEASARTLAERWLDHLIRCANAGIDATPHAERNIGHWVDRHYNLLRTLGRLDVLDDLDVVPLQAAGFLVPDAFNGDGEQVFGLRKHGPVSRQDLADDPRPVVFSGDPDLPVDGVDEMTLDEPGGVELLHRAAYLAAHEVVVITQGGLSPTHWLCQQARKDLPRDFPVSVSFTAHCACAGHLDAFPVALASPLHLNGPLGEVYWHEPLPVRDDQSAAAESAADTARVPAVRILLPLEGWQVGTDAVRVVSDLLYPAASEDNDDFSLDLELTAEAWTAQAAASQGVAALVTAALERCRTFLRDHAGETVQLTIGEDGRVTVA